MVPLAGKGVTARYLVLAFEVANTEAWLVKSAPFAAKVPQGTVELVALTWHPWVTNQPWWRPDGSISGENFGGPVTRESWSSGKEMREIAFRIRGGTNIGSSPVLEFDRASGVAGQGPIIYQEGPGVPYTTIVEPFASPPGIKKTNIRVRDANGLWKVEFRNVSLQLGYTTQVKVVDAAGGMFGGTSGPARGFDGGMGGGTGRPVESVIATPVSSFQGSNADLWKAKARLAELREKYTDNAPQIRQVLERIKMLERGTAQQPTATPRFGPVVERTVASIFDDVPTCFLDLDNGEFRAPQTNLLAKLRGMADRGAVLIGVLEAPGRELYGWLKQTGADMLGCDLEHGATLLFFGTTPVAVSDPALAFDTITPERVAEACRDLKNSWDETKLFKPVPVHRVRLNEEPYRSANLVLFCTREGGMGVMQIVGFTDNPRGVKIRYKLVQTASGPNGPALESAPFVGRLPQGEVELVGIGFNPSANQPWWRPDSSFLQSAPYDFLGASVADEAGKVTREIAVRLRNLPVAPVDVQWRFDPPCDSAGGGIPTRLGTPVADLRAIAVRVPTSTPTLTVRVRVATGKRQTVSESQVMSEWIEFRDVALHPKQPPTGTNATTLGPVVVDIARQTGGPWLAQLPGGETVELAGAGGDGRWWWPDGSPVAGSLYDQERIGVIGLEAVPSNEVRRVFLARLENHTGQSCGMNYEVKPRSCLGGPQTLGSRTVTNGVTVLPFEAWVPATSRTVTVQVGVSCGPWEDVASKEYDEYGQEHGGSRRTSGNLSRAIETKDAVVIMSQDRWPADEVRVAAVRVDGQLVEARLRFESDTDGRQLTATFPGLTLKQVKEIKLQHRPYTWVEFRNVSLQARHSTEVQASPVSSPQPAAFGPVIERVIATPDADDQGLVFFDLETGKSFKPPFPLTFHPNQGPAFVELTPELKQWIKARDVDVLLHLGEKTWDLMTLEMQEDFAGQLNEWETISPEKVIGIFAKKDAEHLVRDEAAASSFGHTYRDGFGSFNAFRTRSNTMGVYQFEGVDNSTRRGVGLRYKLVQSSPVDTASLSADTRRFPATLLVIGGHSVRATTMPLKATTGEVRFMLSNEVAAVNWEFLKTTPAGDVYRFMRKIPAEPTTYSGYPAYEGEQQTKTNEIVYLGRELVIWQDEQLRITLKPDECRPVRP